MPTDIKTGVGRIVAGHPSRLTQKKDQKTKALLFKPDGSPRMQTFMQVAFPKAEFGAVWQAMLAEASTKFPGGAVPPRFAWKYKDGDGVDDQGKPFNTREGWAGHYVMTITSNTGFSPSVYKYNPQTRVYDAVPIDGIKCGDYVVCALQLQVNVPTDRTETPGLYVNPQAIELVGFGAEIVSSGVDPFTAFGGQTYQLPPGASASPVSSAPASVGMPGAQPGYAPPVQPGYAPPVQPGYQQPPMQPAPVYQQPPMQPAPVYQPQPGQPLPAPAHDFVQPQPGAPYQMPGQPPAQPGYQPPQQQPLQPGQMPGMPGPR